MKNKSSVEVFLKILVYNQESLVDNYESQSLTVEPENLYLQPGQCKSVKVTVSPKRNGPVTDLLMLIARNNPCVEVIKVINLLFLNATTIVSLILTLSHYFKVKYEGCRSNVTVEPKIVNFDRVLLHRKHFQKLIFTNNNYSPLFIKICDIERLPCQFSFSETQSMILSSENLVIDICYHATEVQQVEDETIHIQVVQTVLIFKNNNTLMAISIISYNNLLISNYFHKFCL